MQTTSHDSPTVSFWALGKRRLSRCGRDKAVHCTLITPTAGSWLPLASWEVLKPPFLREMTGKPGTGRGRAGSKQP
jgi:hypothetical protein